MTRTSEQEAIHRICALLQDNVQLGLIHARIRTHADSIGGILRERVAEILN